jgi:hypothetical protein
MESRKVFTTFCYAVGLTSGLVDVELADIGRVDVVMLDPNSSQPPPPDLEYRQGHGSHFFELGGVIQEDIAAASAPKTRR